MAKMLEATLFLVISCTTALFHDRTDPANRVVLVLYTGGTIGMKPTPDGYRPDQLGDGILESEHFHNKSYNLTEEECSIKTKYTPLLTLPFYKKLRTLYHIHQYSQLLDSSNMNMTHWRKIAKDIEKYYNDFDGFVVLHGTDTMAYTASVLSFMLENLSKPVIVTGAQVPIYEVMSDGSANFQGALVIAGHYPINEVTLYFNHKLFRGNRATKRSAEGFDAFESPNYPVLANVGTSIKVKHGGNLSNGPFRVNTTLNENVGVLWLYPGITSAIVKSFLQDPIKGVVLKTFGSGNVPEHLVEELKNACDKGIIIVSTSQCAVGHVTDDYLGKMLKDAGVIPGADMTTEAAVAKLSYLLGRSDLSNEKRKEMLQSNLRGELTDKQSIAMPQQTFCNGDKFKQDCNAN
ncbi:hypothetical protein EMCRGX_G022659 [Ephydatia muelleri]|eukprot:Em0017g961a